MKRIRSATAPETALPEVDPKIQEERQRIAEHLVRALREAGYQCAFGDDSTARTLRRDN
jgi:hypothetical protein